MPTIIGMFVGTNELVLMGHGMTAPVSGFVEAANTSFLFRYSSNSLGVSWAVPYSFLFSELTELTSLWNCLIYDSPKKHFSGEQTSL